MTLEGADAEPPSVAIDFVSPNFFRTFGTVLLAGRDFDETDANQLNAPVIVNHRFAEHFGLAPAAILGRRVVCGRGMDGGTVTCEIVGVIGGLRSSGKVTGDIQPQVFFTNTGRDTFYVRVTRLPKSSSTRFARPLLASI
jgi:hypothetical protein